MMRFLVLILALAVSATALAAEPEDSLAPAPLAGKSASGLADELFGRLARTTDADEAAGIVSALVSIWLRSGSDTDDLLAKRAQEATDSEDYALAQALLDAVVAVDPAWAEGWDLRAVARFQSGDLKGAAADIAETLKRNPRHIGALVGLATIFDESGQGENAMKVYERALALAPAYKPLRDAAEKLRRKLAGEPT